MNTNFWHTVWETVKDVLLPIVPSLAGSLVSLQFLGKGLSLSHRISAVCVGTLCAVYVAPVVISWLGINGKELHASLQFLIGLFALAIGREVFREIENGLVQKIREKFLGGGDK